MGQAREKLQSFTPTPARVSYVLALLDILFSETAADQCISGGLGIQGEDDAWDFGTGAGFYVDATKSPYDKGYKMYTYITEELPKVLFSSFTQLDPERVSISGHSMGGHGALTLVSQESV